MIMSFLRQVDALKHLEIALRETLQPSHTLLLITLPWHTHAAIQRYPQNYLEKQKGRIGILLDFVWFEPLTSSEADYDAGQRARDFHVGWFIHPIVYGEYPNTMQNIVKERLSKFTEEEVKIVKGSTG